MELSQIFGYTATTLFSIMLIPQIVKTIKSKDTRGVSLPLFIIYLIANFFAITYAFLIEQNPLKIKYSIAIITTIFYISVYTHYKRKYKC